ncbi:diguanylate cyclase (GGDEF)-like protein [Thiogranum longum]|uniref:Diguanylate cyclase (GGDEF)-like protein n=1 Tax=Thiogranum longum TaxID=1537524 RepID=A0A4R1HB48_9GAMM|nr:EAL domain-containing protein [Thiogranum longum]TCK17425.1 diguanylate cyclase (GGDEF)-like protein [Thiogranum longum]
MSLAGDNTKTIISLGFGAVLALMFMLVFIALEQMQALNNSISSLVEETNAKTAAANTMRDAIRLRAISLKTMRLTADPFERDEEHLRFLGYAGPYSRARELLISKKMDAREIKIHRKLSEFALRAQPDNEYAAELLLKGVPEKEIDAAMQVAAASQVQLLKLLDELVNLEQENAETAIDMSAAHYQETRHKMFALAVIALLFAIVIAWLVIHRIAEKNRRISYQASHDVLTGLINRREFERHLEYLIGLATSDGREHALLYMDLDRFKIINDSCGHLAGDEFLRQLAIVMKSKLRKSDILARLGGDEFGILLMDCPLGKAADIGEELRSTVEDFHFFWDGRTFTAGASVGIVAVRSDEMNPAAVLSTADTACYMAKEAGRNRVNIAATNDKDIIRHRGEVNTISRIKDALEQDRFCLYYQPVVPVRQEQSLSPRVEILVRMIAADGTLVQPGSFIPSAERYNLMAAIDHWVVLHAIDWLEARRSDAGLPVFMINLSGQSLSDGPLLNSIVDKLSASAVSPGQLCFEITETAAVSNLSSAIEFMEAMKDLGCQFALDDFGSGLSSFTYLKRLPVDYLKIDGSFVREIADDLISRAMVKSINDIGHVMGKQTIAEFVENPAILEQVRMLGVDYAQGYGIARPQPLDDAVISDPAFLHSEAGQRRAW